ncbi:AMP-binding protein [Cytobacillus depressus]|uniref:AMP-binding protein n=2 Tax=Cytobacillus depressus TaxID=1602942 RepID=A0A6L3V5I2_9BACI|nr:AMP-binding protein [Cytobacillus depressus]
MNVMTLLSFAEKAYSKRKALVDDQETINYQQLLSRSEKLSFIFFEKYGLASGQKAAFLCKNHASLITGIFAVSRLGADIYLLNTEMSKNQLKQIVDRHDFDLLVYDFELTALVEYSNFNKVKVLSYHDHLPAINRLLTAIVNKTRKLPRASTGKLMLLTSGTTGNAKEVAHQPSLFNYLNPFLSLLTRLKLIHYNTAYIATPIYHGYGIAVLFLFFALGKKVVVSNGFQTTKACRLIREHKVEVVTVVPLMLHKMLKNHAEDIRTLACIASGGAELNPNLTAEVFHQLGDVLYNLYGTSEAGLNMIATPMDLKYSPYTIGKIINGVRLKVLDQNKKEVPPGTVGQFCVKSESSMKNRNSNWIETGDVGYQDQNGYYFLCGRMDDMVVSGGENVYPIELEKILNKHPLLEDVAVVGVSDEQFGQRLKAFVQPAGNTTLIKEELIEWLRPRVARFQMPKEIVFIDSMPYTALGKLDKKQFKTRMVSETGGENE